MPSALIEDTRITLYRHRLAALLRRPSCQWMAFAIGAAPVHRGFFDDVVAAVEGLPAGGAMPANGSSHRQVQYGVRVRILAGERANLLRCAVFFEHLNCLATIGALKRTPLWS